MTDNGNIDYGSVLADLEQRRDALNTAIEAIRPLAEAGGAEGIPSVPRSASRSGGAIQMRPDEFFGMSILQAAKRYLALAKQPKTAPDIAETVKAHGLLNTSKGFTNTVYSVLYRESARGGKTVVRVGNAWGLSEWYPNRPKSQPKGKKAAPDAEDDTDDEAPE
jgi:hypothetical protein